ncbi:helix-turn-helix domain-containing protein [Vagococcus salmoninarum]|uniref:HTH cro/C1-type domain-containing protein n=1 Tax=Vagococcus salmoninarum TaxID=2739 RepID=A0A429ZVF1_9ENTE|nr:helix-turn-helix transcriptional regulator [Vagococcus salmoninarum]RST97734.1 hypothetical protein CBF35_00135 [Vagococcus salmoninarum]
MKQNDLLNELLKPDPQKVGQRIKKIRLKLNLSMSDFALKVDEKSKSGTISNWETGKNLPNKARLEKIAHLGSVTTSELLYGIDKDFIHFIIYLSNEIRSYENNLGFSDNDFPKNYDERFMVISDIFYSLLDEKIDIYIKDNKTKYVSKDDLYYNQYNEFIDLIYSEYKLLDGDFFDLDESITLVAKICDLLIGGVSHTNSGFISHSLYELNKTMINLDSYALDEKSSKFEVLGSIDLNIYNSVTDIIQEAMHKIEKLK